MTTCCRWSCHAGCSALSKVTWPHLLLACWEHTPCPGKQKLLTHERTALKYLQSYTARPQRGVFKRHVCAQFIRMSLSNNVRDQISSCFLHTRSAQITQRTATLPNPLPSSWQQSYFSQSQPLPSYLPWQLPQRRGVANAHAILFASCNVLSLLDGEMFFLEFRDIFRKYKLNHKKLCQWYRLAALFGGTNTLGRRERTVTTPTVDPSQGPSVGKPALWLSWMTCRHMWTDAWDKAKERVQKYIPSIVTIKFSYTYM